jgi:hypothetical protein
MKIPIIIALLSTAILCLEINSTFSIGKIINKYFPCNQNPMNSLPCYGIYDIYFMILLVVILLASLAMIGLKFYKT